ncbi:GNAT family N-acetyltransferase [Paeniglutamicibacter antarcticus]|uniref:GNAT family N-acetyltransferase n=1 Tax=Arthrobacter terrae TaxID=2935737 RepID=A0A931CIR4_9MICC|nr:GNAT family protein [Arthrobacter terrae]MBG0739068.1 GNAT family N-acetyltransferase [Arthrobacter terrae]
MAEYPLPPTTERLKLRRFTGADLDPFFAYQSLPETARYLLNEPRTYTECMARIAMYVDSSFDKPGDWASFAIERADTPGFLGEIALKWDLSAEGASKTGEIGWTLIPDARGKGFATEAAAAVLELAFGKLNFHRVQARLDERNTASAAVCERLGMRREALLAENYFLKGEWTSELIYALLIKDWRQSGAATRRAFPA